MILFGLLMEREDHTVCSFLNRERSIVNNVMWFYRFVNRERRTVNNVIIIADK
jgi:hypothetical protein